nr:MAG TPA: hypothetical protein [Bacteriophage sp.]
MLHLVSVLFWNYLNPFYLHKLLGLALLFFLQCSDGPPFFTRWTGNKVSTCCNHAYKYARTFINSVLNIGCITSTVFVSVFLRYKQME